MGFCTTLFTQLDLRWTLTFQQTNARCLDKGRKDQDSATKRGVIHFLRQLKQCSPSSFLNTWTEGLSKNVMATKAAEFATTSVKAALQKFLDEVQDSASCNVQTLWEEWQVEIQSLAKSVDARLTSTGREGGEDENKQERDGCLLEFLRSLEDEKKKLEKLRVDLMEGDILVDTSSTGADYGYSLLQKNLQFTFGCDPDTTQPAAELPAPQAGETSGHPSSRGTDNVKPRLQLPALSPRANQRSPSLAGTPREIRSPSHLADEEPTNKREISPHGIKRTKVKLLSEEEAQQFGGTERSIGVTKRRKSAQGP